MAVSETAAAPACPCGLFRQLPVAYLLLDGELGVIEGSELFWREMCGCAPAAPGTALAEAVPLDRLRGLEECVRQALSTGNPGEVRGLRLPGTGRSRIADLKIVPSATRDGPVVLIAHDTGPESAQSVAELTLLNDMIRVLRRETQVDRVLFATLTCATAGGGGLGFNRAWVFLVDANGEWLEGRMALGPASAEEAHEIWAEFSSRPARTLDELATAYDRWAGEGPHELQVQVLRQRFSMRDDATLLPVLAALRRQAIRVDDAGNDPRVGPALRGLLGAREFVVVPMVVSGQPFGVLIADNLYSGTPVSQGHVRLLSLFAQHAGIAIEHAEWDQQMEAGRNELARAYATLKDTHEELVRAKQLAVLGEMSARVAHDLRNPLVTLAGWARVLEEEPDDAATVHHAASIIAEEAASLEAILSMLLEPLGARQVRLQPTDLNHLVRDVAAANEHQLGVRTIRLELRLAADLPPAAVDPGQFRRCLVNLVENAVHAMPAGGTLTLSTEREDGTTLLRVADTGIGMTQDMTGRIFDAFFTTRHHGSGLGLAVVWDIVQAHGATIGVESAPGQGATFTIRIPGVETRAPGLRSARDSFEAHP